MCCQQMLSVETKLEFCRLVKHLTLLKQQILDSSKTEKNANDNFKLGENDRKISKRVENTVRK